MLFPEDLRNAITDLTKDLRTQGEKTAASKALSSKYKFDPKSAFSKDKASRLIYLITRLPATFAVLDTVFATFFSKIHKPIHSILDLGSGPATALFVLKNQERSSISITCVERDEIMFEIAKALYEKIGEPMKADFHMRSLLDFEDSNKLHEAVLLSYVLNELPCKIDAAFFEKLENLAKEYLIFVEPGTRDGYSRLMEVREIAIHKGWNILAPCPHSQKCPLQESGRWCHFYKRLQRTKEHRLAKEASLGFEDEKFSYLILSRSQKGDLSEPILLFPKVNSGFVELDICSCSGEEKIVRISRKEKDKYKLAKKLSWGDFLS